MLVKWAELVGSDGPKIAGNTAVAIPLAIPPPAPARSGVAAPFCVSFACVVGSPR